MTDDADIPRHRPLAGDAQASLRDELAGQIASAQAILETQLAELQRTGLAGGDGALVEELRSQLSVLHGLGEFLTTASGAALAQIRAEVATSVAASHSIAQQAQSAITTARAADTAQRSEAVASAQAEARRTTEDFVNDFYEERIFDPYLHFKNADEERAYREREAQRRQAIEDAKAENTPQGDLRAGELAETQLKDSGAHGADHSPQYQPKLDRLHQSNTNLKAAISLAQNRDADASILAVSPKQEDHADAAASLKNAGVVLADQSQAGHGVTIDASLAEALGRC